MRKSAAAAAGASGRKIAAQDPAFGHPEKFCSDIEKTNWESATVTTSNEEIIDQIKKDLQSAIREQERSSPEAS